MTTQVYIHKHDLIIALSGLRHVSLLTLSSHDGMRICHFFCPKGIWIEKCDLPPSLPPSKSLLRQHCDHEYGAHFCDASHPCYVRLQNIRTATRQQLPIAIATSYTQKKGGMTCNCIQTELGEGGENYTVCTRVPLWLPK